MMRCMEIDRFGGLYSLLISLHRICLWCFWCYFCVCKLWNQREGLIGYECLPRDESAGLYPLNKAAGFFWNFAREKSAGQKGWTRGKLKEPPQLQSVGKSPPSRKSELAADSWELHPRRDRGKKAATQSRDTHHAPWTIPRSHTILRTRNRRSNLLLLSFYFKLISHV